MPFEVLAHDAIEILQKFVPNHIRYVVGHHPNPVSDKITFVCKLQKRVSNGSEFLTCLGFNKTKYLVEVLACGRSGGFHSCFDVIDAVQEPSNLQRLVFKLAENDQALCDFELHPIWNGERYRHARWHRLDDDITHGEVGSVDRNRTARRSDFATGIATELVGSKANWPAQVGKAPTETANKAGLFDTHRDAEGWAA